jgi:hypothetical protein
MENAETPHLSPPPEQVAEIDRRAAALKAQPESRRAGELPQGSMLFAFTTGERVKSAALGMGLSEEEASWLLAVPLPSAIEWAASFSSVGVKGVVFDYPAPDTSRRRKTSFRRSTTWPRIRRPRRIRSLSNAKEL